MPRPIKKAIITTISLVGKPANFRKFSMLKSAEGVPHIVALLKSEAPNETAGLEGLSEEAQAGVIAFRRIMNALADQFDPALVGLVAAEQKQKESQVTEQNAHPAAELPEEVKQQIVELRKAQETAQAQVIALQKSLEEQKTLGEIQTKIVEVEKSYKSLPMQATELGTLLVSLRKSAGAEVADKVEGLLTGVEALLSKVMAPIGTSGKGSDEAGSAWERIEKRAQALVQESKAKSFAEGMAKVLASDPKLYDEYTAENKVKE